MTGPMLAAKIDDPTKIRYPVLVSHKLDGIRATTGPEGPRTRSLKLIPNGHVRFALTTLPHWLDGELAVVNADGQVSFRDTGSAVMSFSGCPDFRYFVFDYWEHPDLPFADRLMRLRNLAHRLPDWCRVLSQVVVSSPDQLTAMFEEALLLGHEGLILRDPEGKYKSGRSTLREGGMIKMKPWLDDEATVVEVREELHNANEAQMNELGRTKRQGLRENMIPKGTMGVLIVESPRWPGRTFGVGTGFSAQDRIDLWADKPIGRTLTFKYLDAGGYDVPRHAVFKGFRHAEDMSDG